MTPAQRETPEWKKREQHDSDIRKALLGVEMDGAGRIRRWFGAETLEKLASIGHSSIGFQQCRCRQWQAREGEGGEG